MYYTCEYHSPIGPLTLASDGEHLAGLWMEGQKYFAAALPGETEKKADLPVFARVRGWLDRYFAGEKPAPAELPLAPAGSAFRRAVWALLCQIPYGTVTTYGALAKQLETQLGRPMSARAVGGAVGRNPISVVIPCHRVVGAGGSLTGYAGGIDRKIALLALEGVDTESFTVPTAGTAL